LQQRFWAQELATDFDSHTLTSANGVRDATQETYESCASSITVFNLFISSITSVVTAKQCPDVARASNRFPAHTEQQLKMVGFAE